MTQIFYLFTLLPFYLFTFLPLKVLVPRRSHPAKYGEGFDAPPTLERSGSEHRRAVTSLALLERARAWEWVKDPPAGEGQVGQKQHSRSVTSPLPEEEGLGVKVEPSLAKEGRGGSKKTALQVGYIPSS